MNKIALFLPVIMACASYSRSTNYYEHRQFVAEIVFQDFFNADTISLNVNGCVVGAEIIVTSNDNGLTPLRYIFSNTADNSIAVRLENYDELICNIPSANIMSVKTLINGFEQSFTINLANGRYFGFDKKDNKLLAHQSTLPFEYD